MVIYVLKLFIVEECIN